MNTENVDVTAVMTTHAEGALAAVSYNNLQATARFAEESGVSVEKVVVLDRPNSATRRIFQNIDDPAVRIIETDFGDQGKVRNFTAEHTDGKAIAFLDGDDLWSENWLFEAWNMMREDSRDSLIVHPEYNWFFSGTGSVLINIDQEGEHYREDFLRHANYWDALCMTYRKTHLDIPYCDRRIKDGFAFEDWHWNCETVAAGYIHKVVADTIHFKRRRAGSQTGEASGNRSLMPMTAITDYDRYIA